MQSNDVALLGQSVEQLLEQLPERISSAIYRWQQERPDAIAVRDHLGQVCSYNELVLRVQDCMVEYREQGVGAGDRVLLINENCVALVVSILALSELDAVSVVVNARLTSVEMQRIKDHCQPRLTVCFLDSPAAETHWQTMAGTSEDVLTQHGSRLGLIPTPADLSRLDPLAATPHGSHSGQTPALPVGADLPANNPYPLGPTQDRVCVMIYTTGTTGDPKGVMLSHRNILFVSAVTSVLRGIGHDDRIYLVLPISHVFGFSAVLLASLYVGAELVVADRFDAARTFATFAQNDITGMLGVPTMYARLIEYARAHGIDADTMPKLRFIYCGGSSLDPTMRREAEKLFGLTLLNAYGMTESGPTICQVRRHEVLESCTVGRPLPGLEISLRDAQGRELSAGEVGELHVRGPSVMKGYFRNPVATAAVIDAQGFLNTGDLVRLDAVGNVIIAGRSKELIIHSGFNVYPPEVEAVIACHPDVVLCAVLGEVVEGNENVVAYVQTTVGSTLTEAILREFIKPTLTAYKRPARIVFMEQLPTAASGKVLKHQLRQLSGAREMAL